MKLFITIFIILSSMSVANAEILQGTIKKVSTTDTYDEKLAHYYVLALSKPQSMLIEEDEGERFARNVRVVQISTKGNFNNISSKKGKRVQVTVDGKCYNTNSPHLFEDVMCYVKNIKTLP